MHTKKAQKTHKRKKANDTGISTASHDQDRVFHRHSLFTACVWFVRWRFLLSLNGHQSPDSLLWLSPWLFAWSGPSNHRIKWPLLASPGQLARRRENIFFFGLLLLPRSSHSSNYSLPNKGTGRWRWSQRGKRFEGVKIWMFARKNCTEEKFWHREICDQQPPAS